MKETIYLLICTLCLFTSCVKSGKKQITEINDSVFRVIVMDPDDINKKEMSKVSVFGSSVEYIPLQTADTFLIGEVKKLIVYNDKYYIWDNLSEAIYCFDSEGKFQNQIGKKGGAPNEFVRISDFTVNMENGNILVYSDVDRGLYEYMSNGEFVKKTDTHFVLFSFAVDKDLIYCYIGALPNPELFSRTFPESYRFLTLKDGEPELLQLGYTYYDSFLKVPLPSDNFSFYKDTMLLTEFLQPEIYWIDSIGNLHPRYRIKFSTNKSEYSFDNEIDLQKKKQEEKDGDLTSLSNAFFETDNYLFFNYERGLIGMAYVDKKDNAVYNLGYFLVDDFNNNSLSPSIAFVDEKYMYKIAEPELLSMRNEKRDFSPYLKEICGKINEFDNPIIVRIKLK